MYIILFIVSIASMLLCYTIAKKKGRNPVTWGIIAAIIGPLAIPLILLTQKVDR